MAIIIGWMLFGGLIGYAISQRRGLSPVAGFLGGILLGPFLAPLMFFVTPERQRCPECAEWIQRQAKICPHCKTQVSDLASTRA